MVCSNKYKAKYSIANHDFLLNGGDSVRIIEKMMNFNAFVINEIHDANLHVINFDCDIDFRIEKPIYSVSADGYDSFFGIHDGIYAFEMQNVEEKSHFCMEFRDGETLASSSDDINILRFSLWFAFNILSSGFHAFGVHSSCIVYENAAVMFLGESGTGKSTHTRLWFNNFHGATLLNDDSPILSTETGTPLVYGSPWSGKTDCYRNESFPLKAIVRLRQAPENKIVRLSKLEAIVALYPSYPPAFAKIPELNDRMLAAVSDVISKVPVYQLDCLPNVDAALLSRKTIFGK